MYDIVRHTQKFNTDEAHDLEAYNAIISNPLCTVLTERKEKLRQEEYDGGKLIASEEHVILVVTWEEKTLA